MFFLGAKRKKIKNLKRKVLPNQQGNNSNKGSKAASKVWPMDKNRTDSIHFSTNFHNIT